MQGDDGETKGKIEVVSSWIWGNRRGARALQPDKRRRQRQGKGVRLAAAKGRT